MKKIELLSPVGNFECLKAAVQSGADCVYFGGNMFNARASANNFNYTELKTAIEYAKLRNVKTNLVLNILIKNDEFSSALELASKAYEYGIDAIIVQDLGLAKKLIETFPNLPIHASTQMTIHNLEGVLMAEKLGFKRVVLSRELSINEIEYICKNSNIEIEVFIHGALCICYSGQCLLSSMIGARSGNRGKCAQPCRLPYELQNSNGSTLEKGHLLSTKDLCSLELLPKLVNLGITSFKIEGRLKTPEYVSTVTRIYRKYLDLAMSNSPYIIDEKDKKDLLQVFNRGGFSTGYLENTPNANLIYKEKPNNMGIYIGSVHNFNSSKGYITLKLEDDICIGDTVCLEKEKGVYTISELMIQNKNVPSAHKGDIVKIGRIKGRISVSDSIYKMSSKELNSSFTNLINNENRKNKFNCKLTIHKNKPVSMQIYNNENIDFTVTSDLIPVSATNTPITKERIIEQINKLGGTPFEFKNIDVDLENNVYIPSISKLNQLRRDAISKLEEILLNNMHRTPINICNTLEDSALVTNNSTKQISILLNNINSNFNYTDLQNVNRVYIPLKYFYNNVFSNTLKSITNSFSTYIYMPSVLKNTYNFNLDNILNSYNIQGFVVSNLSNFKMLENYLNNYDFIANYTMNIYNQNTINELNSLGATTITLSPELDKFAINSIKICKTKINTEAIIYGNIPVMTLNYCVLSKSNNCLQTCSNNCNNNNIQYYLKDRMDLKFRIIPDSFSKTTTIYNSKKISYCSKELNVDYIRFDFLDENINEINNIISTFKNGEILEGKDFTNGNYNRKV